MIVVSRVERTNVHRNVYAREVGALGEHVIEDADRGIFRGVRLLLGDDGYACLIGLESVDVDGDVLRAECGEVKTGDVVKGDGFVGFFQIVSVFYPYFCTDDLLCVLRDHLRQIVRDRGDVFGRLYRFGHDAVDDRELDSAESCVLDGTYRRIQSGFLGCVDIARRKGVDVR